MKLKIDLKKLWSVETLFVVLVIVLLFGIAMCFNAHVLIGVIVIIVSILSMVFAFLFKMFEAIHGDHHL